VKSKEDFAAFVQALVRDLRASAEGEAISSSSAFGPSDGGWENPTLERFLDALAAYVSDATFTRPPTWQTFAECLAASKVYE
jgi:hypothetical protein